MGETRVGNRKSPGVAVAAGVYIGRPGVWGNPFRVGVDGDRTECVYRYAVRLAETPWLVDRARVELRGELLICWCAPLLCHGDVLARVADGMEPMAAYAEALSHATVALAESLAALEPGSYVLEVTNRELLAIQDIVREGEMLGMTEAFRRIFLAAVHEGRELSPCEATTPNAAWMERELRALLGEDRYERAAAEGKRAGEVRLVVRPEGWTT